MLTVIVVIIVSLIIYRFFCSKIVENSYVPDKLSAGIYAVLIGLCLVLFSLIIANTVFTAKGLVPYTIIDAPLIKTKEGYIDNEDYSVVVLNENNQFKKIYVRSNNCSEIQFFKTDGEPRIIYKQYKEGTNFWFYSFIVNKEWDIRVYLSGYEKF